jgi:hypothetical protein
VATAPEGVSKRGRDELDFGGQARPSSPSPPTEEQPAQALTAYTSPPTILFPSHSSPISLNATPPTPRVITTTFDSAMRISFEIMVGIQRPSHPVFIDILDDDERFASTPAEIRSIAIRIRELEISLTTSTHPADIADVINDLQLLQCEASFVAMSLPDLQQALVDRVQVVIDDAGFKKLRAGQAIVREAAILADTVREVNYGLLDRQLMPLCEDIEDIIRSVDNILYLLCDDSKQFYFSDIRGVLVNAIQDERDGTGRSLSPEQIEPFECQTYNVDAHHLIDGVPQGDPLSAIHFCPHYHGESTDDFGNPSVRPGSGAEAVD